ncbi:MAG: DUF3788 domain-containing protein [Bacteroides sp.]|nr:DUF3788 domain-containing protein [Bacteroides sp.]
MNDILIFTDKAITPTDKDLAEKLEATYSLWVKLVEYVMAQYPAATSQWSYSGQKSGWHFRLKDKKRAILYFLPREGFFKVSMVFGEKATSEILSSNVAKDIKNGLEQAVKYAEGRGIQIEIKDDCLINDIQTLINIKLSN